MSKNELIPFDVAALPSVELVDDTQLAELSKGADFLQRLQLVTKGKYVDSGKITPGHYGVPQIGGVEILDLGESIDILPLCVRPMALDMRDKGAVIALYDMTLPAFEEIKELAKQSDSSCMWGPSYLVIERSTAEFYELFFGNKSARNESGKMVPFLPVGKEKAERLGVDAHGPVPCTLNRRYATRGAHGWHVPVVNKCSEPFTKLPSLEKVREEIEKFASVKDNGIQNVTEAEKKQKSKRAR